MGSVFKDCSKLKFLNLSNFNTEKFSNLSYFFSGCSELVSLDLSNFNDTNLKNERNLNNIFSNCDSLKYINLENSDLTKEIVINIFKDLLYSYDELIICGINDLIIFNASKIIINCNNNDSNIIKYKNCYIKNNNKINNIKNICDICGNIYYKKHHDINNNDSNINCYIKPNDSYFENINCYETCKSCVIEGNENSHNCLECNDNYTPETNNIDYLNCKCDNYYYKDYYINKTFCTTNKICPFSHPKLIINKSECIDNCTRDDVYKYELDSICYDENIYNQLINKYITELVVTGKLSEKITELISDKKTEKITELITDKKTEKIKKFNSLSYVNTDLITNNIINPTESLSSNNIPLFFDNSIDFSIYNVILNLSDYISLRKYLIGNYIDLNIINSEYKLNNLLITLSTTEKEKNNINNENIKTAINLSECENILRIKNNIPINDSLYIFKLEVEEEGMKIPKVEYEVYYPFNSDKLILLNLSVCEHKKIDISIKVNINDKDLEQYNPNSAYYQDFCTKKTSDFGTDISLLDRKNIFIENNMTLCEEDCDLIEYNQTTKKAKCSCLVKIKIPFINDIKFDKSKLLKNFIDYKNFLNFKFLKCYKQVFNIKSLKKNYGFFIYTFLYLVYFLTLFLFSGKYYYNIILEANKIIFSKNKIIELETKHSRRLSITKDKILNNNKNNNINKKNKRKRNILSSVSNPIKNKINKKSIKKSIKNSIKKPIKKNKENEEDIIPKSSNNQLSLENNKKINKKNIFKSLKNNKDIIEYIKVLDKTDTELNDLEYKESLLYDKRSCLEYYISLLKSQHLLIFSFYCNHNDYNSQIIKIFLVFFFLGLHIIVNALFFTDDTMHIIYIDKGHFNFIYQIPQIIYSTLISGVITTLIKYLALSENNILEIKKEKKFKIIKSNIITSLKRKFILFFIISFLLLGFFLYYISCFCGIYVNTQIHLIKDSIIAFGLSFIDPFYMYIIPCIFRIPALRAKNKDKECMYKFSQFIQNLL